MNFDYDKSVSRVTREAARKRLEEHFQSQAQHARDHGITSEEADAAVEEAMSRVRPRPE